MCHNVEQMPTHSHTPPHTLPFQFPPFSMPKHPLEQLSSTPRRVHLKLLRYCAPKRHVLPPSLSPPLSLLLSLPLSLLSVFFVFLLFYYFAHIRRTLTVRVLPPLFLCFGLSESWPAPEPVTQYEYQRQFPVPLNTQQQHKKASQYKKKIYILHMLKKNNVKL